MVQWLKLCASVAGAKSSIPSLGARIPICQGVRPEKKKEKKKINLKKTNLSTGPSKEPVQVMSPEA